jgi:hypothetical protein
MSLISPEATFPVLGRSSAYRFAAFQALPQIILWEKLPAAIEPGAARSGMTAVVRRMIEAPGTFDKDGWLEIGSVGHSRFLQCHRLTLHLFDRFDSLGVAGKPSLLAGPRSRLDAKENSVRTGNSRRPCFGRQLDDCQKI